MNKEIKRVLMILGLSMLIMNLFACGNNEIKNTESGHGTEAFVETESEFKIEILDAEDILLKTWNAYQTEERFEVMGGHFSSAKIGLPAKYDLTQTIDLVQMYCFPEKQCSFVDDAATMIDLYNAARFTVGAYHVNETADIQNIVSDIKQQVIENEWHGEQPEKLFIIKVDEQYLVSVYGREVLANEFKQKLESVYMKMIEVVVEEKLF